MSQERNRERIRLLSGWVCSSSAFLLFPNRVGNKVKFPNSPDHSPETGESRELFCVQGSPGSGRSYWIRIQDAGSPLLLGSFSGKGKRGDAPKFLVYFIKLTMNMSAMLWSKIFPERFLPWKMHAFLRNPMRIFIFMFLLEEGSSSSVLACMQVHVFWLLSEEAMVRVRMEVIEKANV